MRDRRPFDQLSTSERDVLMRLHRAEIEQTMNRTCGGPTDLANRLFPGPKKLRPSSPEAQQVIGLVLEGWIISAHNDSQHKTSHFTVARDYPALQPA